MARRHGGPARNARPGSYADLYGGGRKNTYDRLVERSLFEDGDSREYVDYVSYGSEATYERDRRAYRTAGTGIDPNRAMDQRAKIRVGSGIRHKSYGVGRVISIRNDMMICLFKSCGTKELLYPFVVDNGIVEAL